MNSAALALQRFNAKAAEPSRPELEAFVAANKRQRPFAWSRVEQLQQACRCEAQAAAARSVEATRVTAEQCPA